MAQCRYCKETIILNKDSIEARDAGTDPHRQMRQHIAEKHSVYEMIEHTRKLGWLIDILFFESLGKPHTYRMIVDELVDFYVSGEGFK